MVADCEDSSLGIYQSYLTFVLKPSGKTLLEQTQCPILSEMRRILLHNYVVFLNIEGVHLYKQTNNGQRTKKHDQKGNGSINLDYYEHTEGINSAHAAVKLLPKLYFERCVNRSMAHLGRVAVFNDACSNGKCCTCEYHKYPVDIYNDDLDILLGEGTSKLSTGFEKSWCKYKWFEKAMASSSLINDVTKTTIYPKKRGSNFYKAVFFGITPYFLNDHGVSTFKYCRPIDDCAKVNTYVKRNYKFLKGVSYVQLCHKDERVMILPVGEYHDIDQVKKDSCERLMKDFKSCRFIKFNERESTEEMEKIVEKESPYRMKAKKIEKVQPMVDILQNRTNYALLNQMSYPPSSEVLNFPYNMIIDDTLHKLDKNKERLDSWVKEMNVKFNKPGAKTARNGRDACNTNLKTSYLSYSSDEYKGGHYNLFVDNYYITDSFLKLIESTLKNGLVDFNHTRVGILTKVVLEELSNDVRIWRITFYLK